GVPIKLTKPKKKVITLPAAALFPVQHSLQLIAAASEGQRVFTADLFDASEKGDKAYATTAYIGAAYPVGFNRQLPAVPNSESLNALHSWPVSLSYYEKSSAAEHTVPTYELASVSFETGVSRRIYIAYGEFPIGGELKELTFLDAPKCDLAKK